MTSTHSRRILAKTVSWVDSLDSGMLFEDFTNLAVPYLINNQAYSLTSKGIDPYEIERALSFDFDGSGVDGFIRGVATRLLTNRELWLEVIVGTEANPREAIDEGNFYVWEVVGAKKTEDGRIFQQPLDKGSQPDWFEAESNWTDPLVLNPDRIVHVSLPNRYSRRTLNRVIDELAEIPSTSTPDWTMGKITGTNPSAPDVDVTEIRRISALRVLQITQPIGWPARQRLLAPHQDINPYYLARRELQFLHFIASMRERAEKALVEILQILSGIFMFSAGVTTTGVPTPNDMCGFLRNLETGHLSYSEINDITYPRGDAAHLGHRTLVV